MPAKTKIEWTDFTSNPIRFRDQRAQSVWGCVKTSPGCAHCYAETIGGRWKRGGPFTAATMATLTPQLDMPELWALLRSKPITGRRVFVGDMTDIFGDWVPDAFLDVLLVVMAYRHDVTFQLLTKRADRLQAYFAGVGADMATWRDRWDVARRVVRDQFTMALRPHQRAREYVGVAMAFRTFPLPNVHVGVSAEDQQRADERIPLLLQAKAAVRFISAEPLLSPVDVSPYLRRSKTLHMGVSVQGAIANRAFDHFRNDAGQPMSRASVEKELRALDAKGVQMLPTTSECAGFSDQTGCPGHPKPRLDWVICGGESGPGARPCNVAWIRSIVQQCQWAQLPVFVKQLGGNVRDRNDAGFLGEEPEDWPDTIDQEDRIEHDLDGTRDGYQGAPVRIHLRSKKGGDPSEWPADLRVRQFPEVAK